MKEIFNIELKRGDGRVTFIKYMIQIMRTLEMIMSPGFYQITIERKRLFYNQSKPKGKAK